MATTLTTVLIFAILAFVSGIVVVAKILKWLLPSVMHHQPYLPIYGQPLMQSPVVQVTQPQAHTPTSINPTGVGTKTNGFMFVIITMLLLTALALIGTPESKLKSQQTDEIKTTLSADNKGIIIQIASFQRKEFAENYCRSLVSKYPSVFMIEENQVFKVLIGVASKDAENIINETNGFKKNINPQIN